MKVTLFGVAPGVEARWIEAGHLLGSARIQLKVQKNGHKKTVVFSGDLGQSGAPLTRYASAIDDADAVFLESTYGDRDHRSFKETVAEFTNVVLRVRTGWQDSGPDVSRRPGATSRRSSGLAVPHGESQTFPDLSGQPDGH